jgi:hypothetical protein
VQQGQTAAVTPTVGYSYSADPLLNQAQALSGQSQQDAAANALALRQQLAQQYGDTALAQQYGDAAAPDVRHDRCECRTVGTYGRVGP